MIRSTVLVLCGLVTILAGSGSATGPFLRIDGAIDRTETAASLNEIVQDTVAIGVGIFGSALLFLGLGLIVGGAGTYAYWSYKL